MKLTINKEIVLTEQDILTAVRGYYRQEFEVLKEANAVFCDHAGYSIKNGCQLVIALKSEIDDTKPEIPEQ